jgi:endo-1,4-beta-mannosidase
MALEKNYTLTIAGKQVVFANAYIKVDQQEGTKEKIRFSVDAATQKDGEIIERNVYEFTPNLGGGNFIKQAYDHLKTLPEFAGATDC